MARTVATSVSIASAWGGSMVADLAADQLAYVRAELGVSVTDLAELLDVARPTVYSWMQGTEPREEHLEHLERLRRLERQVRDVEVYNLSGLSRLLMRPLVTGNTLLDLLNAEQPIGAAMEELCAVARVEVEQRSARKGRQVTRAAAEAARDQSMPGYTSGA